MSGTVERRAGARQGELFGREHQRLTGASDKYFGGFGVFTLALAVVAWIRGEVPGESLAWIAGLSFINIAYSQVTLRVREDRKARLEVARALTNFPLVPFVYCQVAAPLAPWWPLYILMTLASVMVLSFTFTSRAPAWALVVGWALNFAVTAVWLKPLMSGYQVAYVFGSILMLGFVTADWIGTAKRAIESEAERTLELREANRQLAGEKARILELHSQLDAERAKGAQSAKLAALGEMAGGVAHEINTPLAVMRVKTEQLQELLEDEEIDREQVRRAAAVVHGTVDRVASIVKGLRSFSRNADDDPLVPASVLELVNDTLALCREKFQYHGIRIELEAVPAELRVACRPAQISQVLLNLLNNAFDAVSPQSGPKWVGIRAERGGPGVRILVSDSGPGVPVAARARLFQPFFTTKEVGKGTGLGLSVSKGIVEAHGGTLVLDADAPHTRFVLALPLAAEARAAA